MNKILIKWMMVLSITLIFGLYFFLNFNDPLEMISSGKVDKHSHTYKHEGSAPITLIQPITTPELTPEIKQKAKLGMRLFLDENFSSNQQVSCESCHHIFDNGAETIKVSVGVNGAGERNSPTVFNIANNARFFWDGRASSLEKQMDGPVHSPLEMDTSWQKIVAYVAADESYRVQFDLAFNGEINESTVKASLVTFMSVLNTPDSPFDKYLKGEDSSLEPAALAGWKKFNSLGCIVCHQGVNIGGNLFQRFGNIEGTHITNEKDLGRYHITGKEQDKGFFRVASLRNVAETPPYFHDGRTESLEDAIKIMGKFQLGRDLDASTVIELSAFLRSLTAPPPPILKELAQ
ncbi:cytochrome B6 [Photobacterium makurazakiensis]|uniref:cytochrome-c peroxidase n=1 Tax=Photobacterium makurazakiensis TaxID=2910234 RepID=UPI003D0C51FF